MSRGKAVLGLIVGIGVLILGIYLINETTADCGGQTMQAGDTCTTTTNGNNSTTRSVSQQLSHDHEEGWIGVAVGTLVLLGSGYVLVRRNRTRPSAYPGTGAPVGYAGPPNGNGPQPYNPAPQPYGYQAPQPYGNPAPQPYGNPAPQPYGQQPGTWQNGPRS